MCVVSFGLLVETYQKKTVLTPKKTSHLKVGSTGLQKGRIGFLGYTCGNHHYNKGGSFFPPLFTYPYGSRLSPIA